MANLNDPLINRPERSYGAPLMIEAILFDLDDTLLGNNLEAFIPGYFELLANHASRFLEPPQFLQELLISMRSMMANTDPAVSNQDVFWETFQERTGLERSNLEPFFHRFYEEQFPQLSKLTQRRPVAADLIRICQEKGLSVVIATNPVFPRIAIEERLSWAGVPVSGFAFHLVTSYEIMHSTKPHHAYYHEILDSISCGAGSAIMVGDNWAHDIVPAAAVGLHTFWISEDDETPSDVAIVCGHGSLATLYRKISAGWLTSAEFASHCHLVSNAQST